MFDGTVGLDIQIPIRCELDGVAVPSMAVTPDTADNINIRINRSTANVWETIQIADTEYTVTELDGNGNSGDYNLLIKAVVAVTPGFFRVEVFDGNSEATFKTEQYIINIRETVLSTINDVIYAEVGASTIGTSNPVGSLSLPATKLADAQTIATAKGVSKILSNRVTAALANALLNVELTGITGDDAKFVLNTGSTKSIIRNMNVTVASALTNGLIQFYNCKSFASNHISKYSEYYNCVFTGSHTVTTPVDSFIKGSILTGFTLDASAIGTDTLTLVGCYGDLTIINLTTAGTINIEEFNGNSTVDDSCSAGNIGLTGGSGKITIGGSVASTVTINGVASGSYEADATLANQELIIVDTTAIKAKTDSLTFTGSNVHSHTKVQDDIGLTDTQKVDVQAKTTDSLNAYDSANGVATQSSVDGIQNNTRFLASIPTYFIIPTSAENVYKMNVCFYDTAGNMEDPDSNDIGLLLAFTDGTDKNAILFKDYAVTAALDNSGIVGYKKLEKEDTGKYFCYIKIASTEVDNQLIYTFALDENAIRLYYTRSNSIRDAVLGTTTLADSTTNKNIIAESLKEQDVSAITAVSGSIHTDLMDNIDETETKVDLLQVDSTAIKAKTDNLPSDPASETNVNETEAKVDLVIVDTNAIKAKTNNLPASPANEVTLDSVETKVDTLQTNLDDVPDKDKMKDLIFNKKVTNRHANGKPETVDVGSDDGGTTYGTEGTVTTTLESGTNNVETEVIV